MVYAQRTAISLLGKRKEAFNWAKEVAKYINEKFNQNVEVYTQAMGDRPLGTIYWIGKHENLTKLEEFNQKLAADQGYKDLLAKSVDLFVSDSIYDSIIYGPHK